MVFRDEYDSTSPNSGDAINGSGGANNDGVAQTFGVSTGFDITAVVMKTSRSVSTTGGILNVEIWAVDSTGKPTGAPLASGSRSVNGLPQGEHFSTFSMSPNFSIIADTTYAIVSYRDDSSPSADVFWRTQSAAGDEYASSGVNGRWVAWDADAEGGRATWSLFASSTAGDRLFQLLGDDIEGGITQTAEVIVDFDNDGNFESTEAITSRIISLNWNRGKEPEQETTPVGTAVIVVSDPNGEFTPNSTFFGTGNVELNREVRARTTYQGTVFPLFRGRINRIQPNVRPGNVQTATIFIVDEKESLSRKVISSPNSAQSSGNTTPTEGDPTEDITFGSTGTGVIKTILDESSLATDRRVIAEVGSTAEVWWTYIESAKTALDEIERHEGKRSMLYINSSGSMEFHSSTHRNGSTSLGTFGNSSGGSSHIKYQGIQFEFSDRDVLNAVNIINVSYQTQLNTPQFIAKPGRVISTGSTFSWVVSLDDAPVGAMTFPRAERDSTSGLTLRGVGGTTYADDSHANIVLYEAFGGGSAVKITVTNPGAAGDTSDGIAESITVESPSTGDGSTSNYTGPAETFPFLVQLHATADISFESCDPTSITRYGRKFKELKFPFFGALDGDPAQGKLSDRATEELAHNSTAHPSGVNLTLQGTDSDSLRQILSRDMNDRITINDTATLRLSNQDFYITRGEWSLDPGGHMGVVWTLQEAT